MNDQGPPSAGGLGEEAVRLLQALQDWAREVSTEGADGQTAGLLVQVEQHIATGGEDCRYCPLCQLIAAVRATSPEVKQHLTLAASSLLQAAVGLLTPPTTDRSKEGVEPIDLNDDDWEDD